MGKSINQKLAALRGLDVSAPDAVKLVRDALGVPNGFLVAAAAKLVGEHRLGLVPLLAPAFELLLEEGAKRDPGCRGKVAIARALHQLDEWDERVLVRGLRYVQLEGYDREDTAAELRGICGLSHAHLLRPDALDVLAALLADGHRTARLAAAQGIGDLGRNDGGALLRYKLLAGGDESDVTSACLDSLLSIQRESAIELVIGLLANRDETAELAALALGATRQPRAFEPLLRWCEACPSEVRQRAGYLALALLRADPATAYLLGIVKEGRKADAIAAARALATFKDDPALVTQLSAAARAHREPAVRSEVAALVAR